MTLDRRIDNLLSIRILQASKDRGVGGKDLLVTSAGLWVGSDTTHIGHETHARIALMPK